MIKYTPTYHNAYIDYAEVTDDMLLVTFRYHVKSHKYISNSPMSFDIETTQIKENRLAFSYIQQTTINNVTIITRSWDDCCTLWQRINDLNHLGEYETIHANRHKAVEQRRIFCFIANFAFEWQFIKKRFPISWDNKHKCLDVFLTEERSPLHAVFYDGIEVYDALRLTGGNLAMLAKTYTTTQKMVGDLDYTIPRNSKTCLTDEEMEYCVNDAQICYEYGLWFLKETEDIKIPMTNTGWVRNFTKGLINKKMYRRWMYAILDQQMPEELHKLCELYLYRGGYTHGNALYVDIPLESNKGHEILCVDIKSSYPASCFKYMPASAFRPVDNPTWDLVEEYSKKHCLIIHALFSNIEAKTDHSIESQSKCIDIDPYAVIDNGRVHSAEYMEVMLTELDYANYKDFYSWEEDGTELLHLYIADRGELPPYITQAIIHYYQIKEDLGAKLEQLEAEGKKKTQEYKYIKKLRDISKARLNALYGMLVQKLNLNSFEWNGESVVTSLGSKTYDEAIKNLVFCWNHGVWITAHSRRALLSMVAKIGSDVIYCDTDSIYFFNSRKAEKLISDYNAKQEKFMYNWKRTHTQKPGILKDIGIFTYEATPEKPIEKMKVEGAKRYIKTVAGEVYTTIAGLPKGSLVEHCEQYDVEPYDFFTKDGMELIGEESNKLTTKYNDEPTEFWVNGELMQELSSVCLYEIPFKMKLEDQYKAYLQLIMDIEERRLYQNGYIEEE